ncbi:hypothetical protein GOB40_10155 [Sinorhizobium meliloti]|nr:hypothetical protein [Sinorhizobium meliloti]MDX0224945.1 hypothetical protein [Sinorhizobium meliloti]
MRQRHQREKAHGNERLRLCRNTIPVLARMAAKRRAGDRALGYMIE